MKFPISAHLAPHAILHSSMDVLQTHSIMYADKLRQAGTNVRETDFGGVPHVFFLFPEALANATERLYYELQASAEWILKESKA